MKTCALHGVHCKRPRTIAGLDIWAMAHAGIPGNEDPHPDTYRSGKTWKDRRSGAWARRLANRARRAQENAR